MAIYKARINEDDNKIFYLCDWNLNAFNSNYTLQLQTSDLERVRECFVNIDKLEILLNEIVISEFTTYDTYSNITYTSSIYTQNMRGFTECTSVTLQKNSLLDDMAVLINEIKNKNNVNIEAMSVEQYKNYILTKIAETCEADIHQGTEVNGEMFTYKAEDQQNLKVLFDTVVMAPQITGLPYHSSGNACRLYTREEIVTIYMTLMLRLIQITTYCNMLNMTIKEMETKEELDTVIYGMELPEDKQANYNTIVTSATQSFNDLIAGFMGAGEDA